MDPRANLDPGDVGDDEAAPDHVGGAVDRGDDERRAALDRVREDRHDIGDSPADR